MRRRHAVASARVTHTHTHGRETGVPRRETPARGGSVYTGTGKRCFGVLTRCVYTTWKREVGKKGTRGLRRVFVTWGVGWLKALGRC